MKHNVGCRYIFLLISRNLDKKVYRRHDEDILNGGFVKEVYKLP